MKFLEPDADLVWDYNFAYDLQRPAEELKKLYLKVCSSYSKIDLDQKVYRVLKVEHLAKDYQEGVLTLPQISKKTWGKFSGENPLAEQKYDIGFGQQATFDMNHYYGSCWSMSDNVGRGFTNFNFDHDSVRIESTVKKVLAALINTDDIFYTCHYFLGKIMYFEEGIVQQNLSALSADDFVESTGGRVAQSLFMLPQDFSYEEEVRFVYFYQSRCCDWVEKNVIKEERSNSPTLVRHPFDWKGVIENIVYDEETDKETLTKQRKCLEHILS